MDLLREEMKNLVCSLVDMTDENQALKEKNDIVKQVTKQLGEQVRQLQ